MKPIILMLSFLGLAAAQMQNNTQPTLNCENRNSGNRQARHCEMREQTVAYGGQLNVDANPNGGISVKGWNRSDVLVRMKVESQADTDSEARSIAGQVRVAVSAGRVIADGPQLDGNRGWSVSYEIFAPHNANLDLSTRNGGVHLSDLRGNIHFAAVNGGVHMSRVDGNVTGQTTNGGLHIELGGSRWEGQGLDVSTTNGGVHLAMPAGYSAQLEASTVNGGMQSDFSEVPRTREVRHFKANIGAGGAPLKVTTMNGGVKVVKL